MDYGEFEKYAADYVEGNLPADLSSQMDRARQQNPRLEALVWLHRQILASLTNAPEVPIPKELSAKILVSTENQERLLVREKTMFRRNLFLWSAAATAFTALISMLYYSFRDSLVTSLSNIRTATSKLPTEEESSALAKIQEWLSTADKLLLSTASIPGTELSLPAVYILAVSVVAIIFWYCRESEHTTL
jgi:anti-sigma-K factor RskA